LNQATSAISVTASDIDTFRDCESRYFHQQQRYATGYLDTDRLAASVGSAVHDALMRHYRQLEHAFTLGPLPPVEASRRRLRFLVQDALVKQRLDPVATDVRDRLTMLEAGIDRAAQFMLRELAEWAADPITGDLLVWEEPSLDHGPAVKAVELSPGYLVRTRADVLGVRPTLSGGHSVLVQDYKTRREAVDPAFDTGILVRALWVLAELEDPRCRWFMAPRQLAVDPDRIELETVNLALGDTDAFRVRVTLTAEQLRRHRDRLTDIMDRMAVTQRTASADEVDASPNGLCYQYCPFLNRCVPGMAHVRKYYGGGALDGRLRAA